MLWVSHSGRRENISTGIPRLEATLALIARNRRWLTDEGNSRDFHSELAILGNGLTEFESLISGKVTDKGETIKEDFPHPKSSREIAHVAAILYSFEEG